MYNYNLGKKFENIVKKFSDNIAIKFNSSHSITYYELNNKVNQIANFLIFNNVKPFDVVSISGTKNVLTYSFILACLKIGAIYTILDPESPVERLKRIINTCLPKIIIIDTEMGNNLQDLGKNIKAKIINNNSNLIESEISNFGSDNLKETKNITGTNPAYIMFTSGSTGFPKGAVMTHANVLNFISWNIETFKFTPEDILTNVNPLYFDNTVFDFYSSLFTGACLVPFPKSIVTTPQLLLNVIDELKCTSWFSVPSLLIFLQTMKAFNKNNLKYIKRIIFGGEGYPKSKLKLLYDIYSERCTFFNVYGPTECTCMCSSYIITPNDFINLQGFPPLGQIANNFSFLILNEKSERVPDDEIGELCLLGPNVGKGYYNDPERTHKNFVQNPFNKSYSEIMYRTGDLVKINPEDKKIYILGRKDNQIKHMGYRIELEEIETALSCLNYISQVAVLHGERRGLSQIVAIIATKEKVKENKIRVDLKQNIPDYMIPTIFHFEEELPKNPNGKIDRVKLSEKYL